MPEVEPLATTTATRRRDLPPDAEARVRAEHARLESTVAVAATRAPASVESIVVMRANNIGDFVVATPALRALRAAHPEAEVTLIGEARTRPLVERQPQLVDRFLEFPGFPGIRERPTDPARTVAFLADAQRSRFDLAIQMHGNGVWSNPFVALLGAAYTAGFIRAEDSPEAMGLQSALVYPRPRHETLRLLDLLGSIGIPPCGLEPELRLRPKDDEEAFAVLERFGVDRAAATGRPVVGLHPGGRFRDRMWPAERFAELAAALATRFDASIVLTGAPGDRPFTSATRAASGEDVVDLTGELSLPGLAALLARLDLFISNDTGPAHVAYAMGTPSVTLFGAAPPSEWGSLDPIRHAAIEATDACRPCGAEPCIDRISPEAVVAEAGRLLEMFRTRPSGT